MKLQTISKKTSIQLFTLAFILVVGGQMTYAFQNSTETSAERGVTPGKSYSISDIEKIGLYSGDLSLNLPLGSLPRGRGGISGGINLLYSSKLWDMETLDNPSPVTQHDKNILLKSDEGNWRYGYKYKLDVEYLKLPMDIGYCDESGDGDYPYRLVLVMPDGSRHPLYLDGNMKDGYMNVHPDGRAACPNYTDLTGTLTYFTTDGTFLRLDMTTDSDTDWQNNKWTLYSSDGTKVIHNPTGGVSQRIQDRNGNYIDIIENVTDANYSSHKTTYLKDQVNRKVVIEYDAATNQDHIHSKGVAGADIVTKVQWKDIIVNRTYYASFYNPPPGADNHNFILNETLKVVDKVYLPTQITGNQFYQFDYNADNTTATDVGFGEINGITLPSEAKSEYDYFYDGVYNGSGTVLHTEYILRNRPTEKRLIYDTKYDGVTENVIDVWEYDFAPVNGIYISSILSEASITSPDGGVMTENYASGSGELPAPQNTQATYVKGESYKIVGTDGSKVEKYYYSNIPIDPLYISELYETNRYVKYEFVSPKDASGNFTQTAIKEYFYDKNGNMTQVKEYEYVSYGTVLRNSLGRPNALPSGITPERITKTEYYNPTPDAISSNYTDGDSYHLSTSKVLRGTVKAMEVQDASGTPKSRSEMFYDNVSTTGNLTEAKVWDSYKNGTNQSYSNPLNANNSVSTTTTYDTYGNPLTATDAKSVQTQFTYGSINGYSGLYPTQTKTAVGHTEEGTSTAVYDFETGLVTSATDVDTNVKTANEYDDLGRATKVKAAVGTSNEMWQTTEHDVTNRKIITRSDLEMKGDGKKVGIKHFDELGRVRLTRTIENIAIEDPYDEEDGIKVQIRYRHDNGTNPTNSNGTFKLTSNPYRATNTALATNEEAMGWTLNYSPKDGKYSTAETFAGASLPAPFGSNTNSTGIVRTDVDSNRTLVTDQAGKKRISKTNGIGQLTEVWEVKASDNDTEAISFPTDASIAHAYKTSYNYDTLNNLIAVNQGQQTRTFNYSSQSRLLSANNPESGLISYVHDDNGNLILKTDARGVETHYVYDNINRVTQRSYTNEPSGQPTTPTVNYTYYNSAVPYSKGRLTKVSSSVSTTEYTEYDIMGRLKAHKQTTDGEIYTTSYEYNLSGGMIEQNYPSGRKVKNILNNDGELSIVQSNKDTNSGFFDYAKSFTYNATGAVKSMQLGNGKWESTTFNSRLQPTQIALGTVQNGTDKLKLNFDYNTVGQNGNNGNILKQTITVPNTVNATGFTAIQTYNYDELNRLKSAEEKIAGSTSWKQTFTFDRYGNKRFDEANTDTLASNCVTAVCNPTIDPATNKLVGYTFDNVGNTETDANGRTYTYDGENKQILVKDASGTIGEYFYDGDGKRIKKITSTEETIFVYNGFGQLVADYSTQIEQTAPKVSYLTSDHLGSPRITTDKDGDIYTRRDFMPFGEEIDVDDTLQRTATLNYASDEIRQKFTTYERDEETELDFAQSRMHNYSLGRFNSPDDFTNDTHLEDPSSWNLYLYVRNNPLNFIDPNGEEIWVLIGGDPDNGALQYKNGKLYTKDGKEYKGDDKFALKVLEDLNKLKSEDSFVRYVINTLADSKREISISGNRKGDSAEPRSKKKRKNNEPTGTFINYLAFIDSIQTNKSGKDSETKGPSRINLAHELWHAFVNDQGRYSQETWLPEGGDGIGSGVGEAYAVNFENRSRSAIPGIEQRTTYGVKIPSKYLEPRVELNNKDKKRLMKILDWIKRTSN